MRLLDTSDPNFPRTREFVGSDIPPYAILSHTWGEDELTLQQLTLATSSANATVDTANSATPLRDTTGLRKIQQTCRLARTRDSLAYAWVDTCCIDKTSSAELTEAINSMYAWYANAAVCYVYLADLEPALTTPTAISHSPDTSDDSSNEAQLAHALPTCRWFTRGWTLQELLGPRDLHFFDRTWTYRGTKSSAFLSSLLSRITGIPASLLRHDEGVELSHFAVAKRMSWAAKRETTRPEDMAYCLLGLFEVNLGLVYGEGAGRAFERLQEEVVRRRVDMSIFGWTREADGPQGLGNKSAGTQYAGVLAESPRDFARCGDMELCLGDSASVDFAITTRGIQTEASLIYNQKHANEGCRVMLDLYCTMNGTMVGISLRKIGGGLYARFSPGSLVKLDEHIWHSGKNEGEGFNHSQVETLTLATRLPSRFPFHPGNNPVLGNRCSALKVRWEKFVVRRCRTKPRSHWDVHDGVFFSTNRTTKGWCAFIVDGWVGNDMSHKSPFFLSFLLACFRWNSGEPRVFLANLNQLDSARKVLIESQLDLLKFESSQQAASVVERIFQGRYMDRLVVGETGDSHFIPYGFHTMRTVDGVRVVGFTVRIQTEAAPGICANPMTVVDISVSLPH